MQKTILAAALLAATTSPALAAAAPSCQIPGSAQALGINNLAWVDPGRTMRSGGVIVVDHYAAGPADAPTVLAAYKRLRDQYHVGAVLNLRAESQEDQAAAKALGMRYTHIAIPDGDAPTPSQVKQFFGFLHDAHVAKRVALWHCAGGIGRTGVLAGMLRLREGWTTEAAAKEMFGMGLNYNQAVNDLPALNAFAAALGKPGYYPADWTGPRKPPYDYKAIVKQLPSV